MNRMDPDPHAKVGPMGGQDGARYYSRALMNRLAMYTGNNVRCSHVAHVVSITTWEGAPGQHGVLAV